MTDIESGIQIALRIIHQHLKAKNLSIATAESLTAGLISATLASQSGSSAYLKGSIVAYTLDAKVKLLCVDREKAAACNCVSAEVARAMAEGTTRLLDTDCVIAVTGYAEPHDGREPHAHYFIICNEHTSGGIILGGSRTRNEMRHLVVAATLGTLAGMLEVAA